MKPSRATAAARAPEYLRAEITATRTAFTSRVAEEGFNAVPAITYAPEYLTPAEKIPAAASRRYRRRGLSGLGGLSLGDVTDAPPIPAGGYTTWQRDLLIASMFGRGPVGSITLDQAKQNWIGGSEDLAAMEAQFDSMVNTFRSRSDADLQGMAIAHQEHGRSDAEGDFGSNFFMPAINIGVLAVAGAGIVNAFAAPTLAAETAPEYLSALELAPVPESVITPTVAASETLAPAAFDAALIPESDLAPVPESVITPTTPASVPAVEGGNFSDAVKQALKKVFSPAARPTAMRPSATRSNAPTGEASSPEQAGGLALAIGAGLVGMLFLKG